MPMSRESAAEALFGRDFAVQSDGLTPKMRDALREAEERGYARGLAEGSNRMAAEHEQALAIAVQRVADASATLLSNADARAEALEREAIAFATALARKLAGDALARFPMRAIEEVAREAFQHLRGVPHLVVRVNDALVDDTDKLVKKIGRERGFEGRIVTMGDPEIACSDARFEWADGGVVRDGARIGEAVASSITSA
jgi:flagellar assembly protein FliH